MTNGDNNLWNWSSIERERVSCQPVESLRWRPFWGQRHPVNVRPLRACLFCLWQAQAACLTTLWNGFLRINHTFFLYLSRLSLLFVIVSDQGSLWNPPSLLRAKYSVMTFRKSFSLPATTQRLLDGHPDRARLPLDLSFFFVGIFYRQCYRINIDRGVGGSFAPKGYIADDCRHFVAEALFSLDTGPISKIVAGILHLQ